MVFEAVYWELSTEFALAMVQGIHSKVHAVDHEITLFIFR